MTLIYSALAGGDCIEDTDRMRVAATTEVLGHGVRAPSTLGTFLRSFSPGDMSPSWTGCSTSSIRRSWPGRCRTRCGAGHIGCGLDDL